MSEKWTVNEMDQNIHKAANIRAEKDGLPDVIAAHRNAIESCAAGPWQYPPAEPPMDGSLLLIEDDFGYSKARWDAEEKSWKDGFGIYWEVIKENWKRWAVINEEKKP